MGWSWVRLIVKIVSVMTTACVGTLAGESPLVGDKFVRQTELECGVYGDKGKGGRKNRREGETERCRKRGEEK